MKPDASHVGAKYRPEIDGLRALAVIPVILFHAGFDKFRGGYLGVDVFFVVSGYLITSIILTDHAANRFTVASFYERRARRILPALFLVMATCVPFAALWMLPVELEHFSRSLLAAITFVPNIYFWRTTSYFDTSAETVPLLHTWSLGVEEQFYFVFPLMVAAAWRFGTRTIAGLTLAAGVVSFGIAEWAWRDGKAAAGFFLAPPRAWELMIGSLIAIVCHSKPIRERVSLRAANLASAFGLAVLALSFATFDASTPMPSVYGLAPTMGTGMVIAFAGPGTIVYRVLATRLAVGIGLVSYSAYLWHQPLFSFARLRLNYEPSLGVYLVLILLTFVFAYGTWRFVETPFRQRKTVGTKWIVRGSAVGTAVLAAVGLAGHFSNGWQSRLLPEDRRLAEMADPQSAERYVPKRFVSLLDQDFSDSPKRKVLIIGDSYAQDFVNATFESGRATEIEIRTILIEAVCQIYFGDLSNDHHIEARSRPKCKDQHSLGPMRSRIESADLVVLAASWQTWAIESLPDTLAAMRLAPHQQAFVVGPKGFGRINFRQLLSLSSTDRIGFRQAPEESISSRNEAIRRQLPDGLFVDMQHAVCNGERTCPLFSSEGELMTFDGSHLTQTGARAIGSALWSSEPLSGWIELGK